MGFVISWSAEFATGIDIIDEQHKRIFEYLTEIDHAIKAKSTSEVEYVVKALLDYAVSHNTFEESLMDKAGYPMLEAHHQVHEAFKNRAHDYVQRLAAGEDHFRLAREVRTDIGLWLTNHIKRDDKHYVPYVKKSLDGGFVARMLGKFFG
jgi:hemerythrin-like metal-binding domain